MIPKKTMVLISNSNGKTSRPQAYEEGLLGKYMAGGLDGEISKLRHKDVRQRRRAVRVLFDTDLPRALDGFVPLLDDRDPWFRSKALDAHRRWAPSLGPSALKTLANHRSIEAKRCAANLLSEFKEDVTEVALLLVDDEDLTCRRKSAAALLNGPSAKTYVERFFASEDAYLRRLAALSSGADAALRRKGIEDTNASVCEAALQAMEERGEPLDEAALVLLMERGINGSALIQSAIDNHGDALVTFAQSVKGPTLKKLVGALREQCTSVDDAPIETLLAAKEYIVIGRWLQGMRNMELDQLRWKLIRDSTIDQIERSRWIERLLGRCDELPLVEEARLFISEEHPELLIEAAQNLSTAYDKLGL